MIETTINIHVEIMEIINKIASTYNISRNKVIKNLLKRTMDRELNRYSFNKCIEYQNKDSKDKWHKFHITLNTDEYEFFIDLRKFFKKSVSAILAFAVKKYYRKLNKFITTDNYLFKNYVIIKETINNVITWKLYWGWPEKMGEILKHNKDIPKKI